MGRNKSEAKAHLPPNLYVKSDGYYWYRDPIEKRTVGLGRDESVAVARTNEMNAKQALITEIIHGRRVEIAKRSWAIDKNGLVELDFLRTNAEQFDKVCGIYFLLYDGEVVYVGQSINAHNRIAQHYNEGTKVFDSIYIIRTEAIALNQLEALYIKKFRPKYNVSLPLSNRETAWGIQQSIKHTSRDFGQRLDDGWTMAGNPHES